MTTDGKGTSFVSCTLYQGYPQDPVLAESARALVSQGAAAQGADNIKQMAKFVLGLQDCVAGTGM